VSGQSLYINIAHQSTNLHCTSIYTFSLSLLLSLVNSQSFKRFTKKVNSKSQISNQEKERVERFLANLLNTTPTPIRSKKTLLSLVLVLYFCTVNLLIYHLKHSLFLPLSLSCRILNHLPLLTTVLSVLNLALFDALVA
jgi:hypothetical protein